MDMQTGVVVQFNRRSGRGVVQTKEGSNFLLEAGQQTLFRVEDGALCPILAVLQQIPPQIGDEVCFVLGLNQQVMLWNYKEGGTRGKH